MNKKLLISILLMSFLMVGSVSATLVYPAYPEPTNSGKETFELGYDCYREPYTMIPLPWNCKQVEHKRDWFIKNDFYILMGSCDGPADEIICHYTWHRLPKA